MAPALLLTGLLSGALLLVAVAGGWWARHRLVRVRVLGDSMYPTLAEGDVVLVRRTTGRGLPPGRMVVAAPMPTELPADRVVTDVHWLVKRVLAVRYDDGPGRGDGEVRGLLPPGTVYLVGDNVAASYDSRTAGPWPVDLVRGVVMCRLRRAHPDPSEERHSTA